MAHPLLTYCHTWCGDGVSPRHLSGTCAYNAWNTCCRRSPRARNYSSSAPPAGLNLTAFATHAHTTTHILWRILPKMGQDRPHLLLSDAVTYTRQTYTRARCRQTSSLKAMGACLRRDDHRSLCALLPTTSPSICLHHLPLHIHSYAFAHVQASVYWVLAHHDRTTSPAYERLPLLYRQRRAATPAVLSAVARNRLPTQTHCLYRRAFAAHGRHRYRFATLPHHANL